MSKITGIVHTIEETKTFGAKGFRKRRIILEQERGSYTNYLPIDFTRDSCDELDALKVGDEISVEYRLSGRLWQKDPSAPVQCFSSIESESFDLIAHGKPQAVDGPSGVVDDDEDAPF